MDTLVDQFLKINGASNESPETDALRNEAFPGLASPEQVQTTPVATETAPEQSIFDKIFPMPNLPGSDQLFPAPSPPVDPPFPMSSLPGNEQQTIPTTVTPGADQQSQVPTAPGLDQSSTIPIIPLPATTEGSDAIIPAPQWQKAEETLPLPNVDQIYPYPPGGVPNSKYDQPYPTMPKMPDIPYPLPNGPEDPYQPDKPSPDKPADSTDGRAKDVIDAVQNPPTDEGLLFERIKCNFLQEQVVNGLPGMRNLAKLVNDATDFGLYVDRFRGGKVYALYFNYNGRNVELPITGRC